MKVAQNKAKGQEPNKLDLVEMILKKKGFVQIDR